MMRSLFGCGRRWGSPMVPSRQVDPDAIARTTVDGARGKRCGRQISVQTPNRRPPDNCPILGPRPVLALSMIDSVTLSVREPFPCIYCHRCRVRAGAVAGGDCAHR